MNKKIVVVNSKRWRRPAGLFAARLGAETVFTEYAGHATEIARRASGYDTIVAAGGDGTIAEIANGMDLENQVLGIIPLGSGNSLARDLQINSVGQALSAINKNRPTRIDIIDCEFKIKDKVFKKYAVTTTGMGFVSAMVDFANNRLKSLGKFCYLLSGCRNLFNRPLIPATIRIDDLAEKEIEFTLLLVNNTAHAGSFRIFFEADIKDSCLDLGFAKTNLLTQFLNGISAFTGTGFCNPLIQEKIKKLVINLKNPALLMLDGEVFGPVDKVSYSIVPEGLGVLS